MKLSAHYETETYMTESGYYAIRQDDPHGGDPVIILLKHEQLRAMIKDMAVALEHPEWFETARGEE